MRAENIPSHLASMGKESEASDTLVSAWKNSIIFKEIEKLLTLLEQREEESDKAFHGAGEEFLLQDADTLLSGDMLEWHIPEGLGAETSRPSGLSPANASILASTERSVVPSYTTKDCGTQTISPEGSADEGHRLSPNGPLPPSTDLQPAESRPLQLPSNAWPLLDIYFSYTQCWFPILEKHDIFRTAFRYTEEDIRTSSSLPGSGEHATLWAVLALSSFQEASITATRQATHVTNGRPHPGHLYATAKGLIPAESGIHETGHAQALLILSLIKFGQQQWTTAWMLVGHAIRIVRYLKLDCPSATQSNATGSNPERLKHVFLGCFVLETLISVQTSRAPSLRKEDLAKMGAINEDGMDEWSPWEDQTDLRSLQSSRNSFHRGPLRGLSTFNRLGSLMSILNELCFPRQNPESMSQLEMLERQLQLWVTALPKSYRVDLGPSPTKTAPPHIFGLEIAYEGVVVILSLQAAYLRSQRNEISYQQRAADSSKRLLQLLQTYMETYSVSATSPIFGMILTFGCRSIDLEQPNGVGEGVSLDPSRDRRSVGLGSHHETSVDTRGFPATQAVHPFELEPGLKDKLRTFSLHVASVWSLRDGVITSQPQIPGTMAAHVSSEGPRRRIDTPCLGESDPGLSSSMLPDLPVPSHPISVQYPPVYNDSNINMESFVDINGYGAPLPRIAPDLDALFDELASLDGTER